MTVQNIESAVTPVCMCNAWTDFQYSCHASCW